VALFFRAAQEFISNYLNSILEDILILLTEGTSKNPTRVSEEIEAFDLILFFERIAAKLHGEAKG